MPHTPEQRIALRNKRIAMGVCIRCVYGKAVPGIQHCEKCRDFLNERDKNWRARHPHLKSTSRNTKWRAKRNEKGLCWACGKNPRLDRNQLCAECKDKRYAQVNANKDRKRREGICLACTKPAKKGRVYCEEHTEKNNKRNKDMRKKVLDHYGRICKCCGESTEEFLAIDHINGRGTEHTKRIGSRLYSWLVKSNFPEGFQTLCHNCNSAKGYYGECPHEKWRRENVFQIRKT